MQSIQFKELVVRVSGNVDYNPANLQKLLEHAVKEQSKPDAKPSDAILHMKFLMMMKSRELANIRLQGAEFQKTVEHGNIKFEFVKKDGIVRVIHHMDQSSDVVAQYPIGKFIPMLTSVHESFNDFPAEIRQHILELAVIDEPSRIINIDEYEEHVAGTKVRKHIITTSGPASLVLHVSSITRHDLIASGAIGVLYNKRIFPQKLYCGKVSGPTKVFINHAVDQLKLKNTRGVWTQCQLGLAPQAMFPRASFGKIQTLTLSLGFFVSNEDLVNSALLAMGGLQELNVTGSSLYPRQREPFTCTLEYWASTRDGKMLAALWDRGRYILGEGVYVILMLNVELLLGLHLLDEIKNRMEVFRNFNKTCETVCFDLIF